jgi:phosphoadenosine phosphosulfate reductase
VKKWTEEEILLWAYRLEGREPQEILQWMVREFGKEVILASSFGAEDVVLIDMLLKISPKAPIFYLDTNKHFRETYETRDRLQKRYKTTFIQVLPEMTLEQQKEEHGDKLWERNPNLCCEIRKVRPLSRILSQYKAWITGIRRDQAPTRAHARKLEWDSKFQLVKCNPLASWNSEDVWTYIRAHDIPYNPLHDRGYPSIGCEVCTRPVGPGEDPRAGRWAGFDKTECGLHK